MATHNLTDQLSVNPISTRGTGYTHHITTYPPRIFGPSFGFVKDLRVSGRKLGAKSQLTFTNKLHSNIIPSFCPPTKRICTYLFERTKYLLPQLLSIFLCSITQYFDEFFEIPCDFRPATTSSAPQQARPNTIAKILKFRQKNIWPF